MPPYERRYVTHHALPRGPTTRHHMMHPWLPAAAWRSLAAEAKRRGHHPDVLAALVLEIVAVDDLFTAVIDR